MCSHDPKHDILRDAFMPEYEDDHPEGVEYIQTSLTPQQQEYLDKMEDIVARFTTPPDFSRLETLLTDFVNSQKAISNKLTGDIQQSREKKLLQLEEKKVQAIVEINTSLKKIASFLNGSKPMWK